MRMVRLLFALSLICSSASAATRTFVSALNGVDTNPCTRSAPCRSFTAALLVTDITGEVIALDSGGYGPMTISFAVSVIAPGGVYAGITALSGDAITVNSGIGPVILKNLFLNNVGGNLGINVTSVRSLHVEGCTISGFSEGILFNSTMANARLYVRNSEIRRSFLGIFILPASQATLESVHLYGNDSGVEVSGSGAEVTIRKSIAAGPGTYGFRAELNSKMTIEDSVATSNVTGFYASDGAIMFLVRCQAVANNSVGLEALLSPSAIYVSDSTITRNSLGIYPTQGGVVLSRCTDVLAGAPPPPCPAGHFSNTLLSNTSNGTFSGSYSSN
jgi:hypothetical protein